MKNLTPFKHFDVDFSDNNDFGRTHRGYVSLTMGKNRSKSNQQNYI